MLAATYAREGTISIHASRVGGDRNGQAVVARTAEFQSTPPGWEATRIEIAGGSADQFQSTPPGWEATFLRTR